MIALNTSNSLCPTVSDHVFPPRDHPVHLYDAYTGIIRASYRPYNALDELESPSTLCFLNGGQHLITGGFRSERMLQIFDLSRPGKDPSTTLKLGKTRRSKDGQKGLVSALSSSPVSNLLAVGTYSPGSIYLYDTRAETYPIAEMIVSGTCIVGHGKSHSRKRKHALLCKDDRSDGAFFSAAKVKWFQSRARGGVTQVEFSDNGYYLYSSSRRSNAILQWDLRRIPASSFCPGIASFETDNNTNQQLEFSLHKDHIFVGGRDNCVRIYDCNASEEAVGIMDCFQDAVNGVSVASLGEKMLMASSSGSRHFPSESDFDTEGQNQSNLNITGSVQLHEIKLKTP